MKVSGNTTDYIHNNFRTLAPLNCILSIVGLGCNLTCKNKSKPCVKIIKNVFRASILAGIVCYTLYYKLKYLYSSLSPSIKYTDMMQMIYDFTQYIIDLYFIRKYGTDVSIEYFKQYIIIDQILGEINYCSIRRNILMLMGIFAVVWMTSTTCDYAAWILSYGFHDAAIYSIMYIFLLIKILTTLDLTSQVMHIEARLSLVGDLVQRRSNETQFSSPSFERNNSNEKLLGGTATSKRTPTNSLKLTCIDHQDLKWLSRCYLLLSEQAAFVNKLYGIRILLNSLSLLIDMVRFTNIAARLLIGTQHTRYASGYFPVISSIMRMLTCAAVLGSLVYHCEQVYRQRERILDIIDYLLIFKTPSNDVKTTASELRDLIQARPINFNMANFSRIDYTLLVSIASVVVTYTIILLQN